MWASADSSSIRSIVLCGLMAALLPIEEEKANPLLRRYQGGSPASLLLDPRMFLARHPPPLFRRKVKNLCALRREDCEQQVQTCKLVIQVFPKALTFRG